MKPPMLHQAYKVNYTRNAYGDYVSTSSTVLNCHFRYINEVITSNPTEQIQSDAIAWFEPDADINMSDIVLVDGNHYRVEKLIRARKLRSPVVQFRKAYLALYGVIS